MSQVIHRTDKLQPETDCPCLAECTQQCNQLKFVSFFSVHFITGSRVHIIINIHPAEGEHQDQAGYLGSGGFGEMSSLSFITAVPWQTFC